MDISAELKKAKNYKERYHFVNQLYQYWGILISESAPTQMPDLIRFEENQPLSIALRELYQRFGTQFSSQDCFNRLLLPNNFVKQYGLLNFYTENQGVWLWGIPLDRISESDPPVCCVLNEGRSEPSEDNKSVSEFFVQMSLTELVLNGSKNGCFSNSVDAKTLFQITHRLTRLPLPDWNYPVWQTCLYECADTLVQISNEPGSEYCEMFINSATKESHEQFKAAFPEIDWDH